LELPELNIVVGLVLAITGPFVMFTKRNEVLEVIKGNGKSGYASTSKAVTL